MGNFACSLPHGSACSVVWCLTVWQYHFSKIKSLSSIISSCLEACFLLLEPLTAVELLFILGVSFRWAPAVLVWPSSTICWSQFREFPNTGFCWQVQSSFLQASEASLHMPQDTFFQTLVSICKVSSSYFRYVMFFKTCHNMWILFKTKHGFRGFSC